MSINNSEQSKETSRIEAFSDGVFAIAITLLILDLHVPEMKEGETLIHNLLEEWASMLAFLLGFFTILICWINHHFMFRSIYRSDSILLLLNGFKLLVVSVTPFATAILSKHLQSGWKQEAVNLFCFNFTLMGLAMTGVYAYAYKKGYTAGTGSDMHATKRLYVFAGICSASIWLISFLSIPACLALSAVMFLIFLFPKHAVAWQVKRMQA